MSSGLMDDLQTSAGLRRIRDAAGRGIGYLRLSLTKACSMRCTYCRPALMTDHRGETLLSVDEIEALVRHLVQRHGLAKVRLTGGDPSSRPELTARSDGPRRGARECERRYSSRH